MIPDFYGAEKNGYISLYLLNHIRLRLILLCLIREKYQNGFIDEAVGYRYNERNELTERIWEVLPEG